MSDEKPDPLYDECKQLAKIANLFFRTNVINGEHIYTLYRHMPYHARPVYIGTRRGLKQLRTLIFSASGSE